MEYTSFEIRAISFVTPDTFILQVNQQNPRYEYSSGQYCYIQNPQSLTPDESRPFSIASPPLASASIEFCVKIYGEWTRQLSQLKPGEHILLSLPQDDTKLVDNPFLVFLVGGVGIAPVISMLRHVVYTGISKNITVMYGNKTAKDIIYRQELESIASAYREIKIIHILSEEPDDSNWKGERGLLTNELVRKYVDITKDPFYYIYGNPIFIGIAKAIVSNLKKETPPKQQES
jgi:NAD(P)H-flavin reductase